MPSVHIHCSCSSSKGSCGSRCYWCSNRVIVQAVVVVVYVIEVVVVVVGVAVHAVVVLVDVVEVVVVVVDVVGSTGLIFFYIFLYFSNKWDNDSCPK